MTSPCADCLCLFAATLLRSENGHNWLQMPMVDTLFWLLGSKLQHDLRRQQVKLHWCHPVYCHRKVDIWSEVKDRIFNVEHSHSTSVNILCVWYAKLSKYPLYVFFYAYIYYKKTFNQNVFCCSSSRYFFYSWKKPY